jgi:hypothetical protein
MTVILEWIIYALKHLRLFWLLRSGTKISDAKFVKCYLELFLGGAATKIPEKIKSVGFVSGVRLCHEHKMSATTNNFLFAKQEWPEKAGDVLYIFWLLSFEPGPDPNIICATRPRPALGPGRAWARAKQVLIHSFSIYMHGLFLSHFITLYQSVIVVCNSLSSRS